MKYHVTIKSQVQTGIGGRIQQVEEADKMPKTQQFYIDQPQPIRKCNFLKQITFTTTKTLRHAEISWIKSIPDAMWRIFFFQWELGQTKPIELEYL